MTTLSSVTSSQTASTNIVIEQGISMLAIVAIVIVVAVVALLTLVLWKKGKKGVQP
jgi:heme/copper-type cytochrome/quinol oxidase subunit 2